MGDPKQAIYRFRGADVDAYVQAARRLPTPAPESILEISTNFRSVEPILTFVNERFEAVLSADGQPGFSELSPFHPPIGSKPVRRARSTCGRPRARSRKPPRYATAEALAVAELCARLIGNLQSATIAPAR